jgi:hypothetical protein
MLLPGGTWRKKGIKMERFQGNCKEVTQQTSGTAGMLACQHRVCYKFVAELWLRTSAFHQFSCARN